MDIKNALLNTMEETLGFEHEEMQEYLDVPLISEGILDSLTIVSVISNLEKRLGKKIDIRVMKPEDFQTINSMTAALEKQLGK